jgi:hypothetical protein
LLRILLEEGQSLDYSLNSGPVQFVDAFEGGSKGTENPLRALARASSGDISSLFTPEGNRD